MARQSLLSQKNVDKAKDTAQTTYENAKDVAQTTYENAKDVAQSTYSAAKDTAQTAYENVQDTVQSGAGKTSAAVLAALGAAQGLLKYNEKQTKKNAKKAQSVVGDLQDNVQEATSTGLSKASDLLSTGTDAVQKAFEDNSKRAQKQLKRTQKQLRQAQKQGAKALTPVLEKTGDALGGRAKQVGKTFAQVTDSAKDFKDSVQEQYAKAQRRRQRARALFRWGLVIGIVLTILYTPVAGEEVRRRIMAQWEQYRGYFGL